MVRIAMQIPDSYELFISPAACGRHGALGALIHGIKERLSYYYVDEKDVVRGYDSLIVDAVKELLERLAEREIFPRVITLFVTCIDDLIGTDTAAVAQELEELHPGIYFIVCHMNPITEDSKEPPMVSVHKSIYSLLVKSKIEEKDQGVNCLGNLVDLHESCEIRCLLDMLGVREIRHISRYNSFEDFCTMKKSVCSLILFSAAKTAAEVLRRELDQPWLVITDAWNPMRIRRQYKELAVFVAGLLGTEIPETYWMLLEEQEKRLAQKISEVRERVGAMAIAVDDFSCPDPFELAIFLLEEGLRVTHVIYREISGSVRENQLVLRKKYPNVREICSLDYRVPGLQLEDTDPYPVLAVGAEAAYILKTDHVVDRYSDQGNYGYQGLLSLLDEMTEAAETVKDLQAVIEDHGLVV